MNLPPWRKLLAMTTGNDALAFRRWEAFGTAALIFLALSIGGISADEHLAPGFRAQHDEFAGALWSAWIALPLALCVIALGVVFGGQWRGGVRLAILVMGIALVLGLRLWLALRGPLPYLAFRGLTDLFFASLAALALGSAVRRFPLAAHGAWIAALVLIFGSRLSLASSHFVFRPDLLPVTISILWAVAAIGGVEPRPPRWNLPLARVSVLPAHLMALAAGALFAWLAMRYHIASGESALLAEGPPRRAAEWLWTRSALLGWGKLVMLRLVHVMSRPGELGLPPWLGWRGLLAAHGLAAPLAALAAAVLTVRTAHLRAVNSGLSLGRAPQMALLAGQFMIGLIVVGGPNSGLALLVAAGWMGLGFGGARPASSPVDAPSPDPLRSRWRRTRAVASASALLALAGLCLAALAPTRARVLRAANQRTPLGDPNFIPLVRRAQRFNPWHPRVELARAAWLREELQRGPGWDESLYRQIGMAYIAAMELDPYDPLIPLRWADVQLTARRVDDALNTARRALLLNPAAPELMGWIYLTALAEDRPSVALEMIRQSLLTDPASERWWRERYRIEQSAGRGVEAGRALYVAMTSGLGPSENPRGELVKAAFARRHFNPPPPP